MFRCSTDRAPFGNIAAKIGIILMAAVSLASGEDSKSAWRQLVNISSVNCMVFEGPICWAGTTGGLLRFDENKNEMTVFTNCNSPLPSNTVNVLAFGNDSSLWVGTSEGLARLKQGTWQLYTGPASKTPHSGVTALAPGDSSSIWVGYGYGGVGKVSAGTWTSLTAAYPGFPLALIANPTRSVARDWANRLWIFSSDFLLSTMACLEGSKWTTYDYFVYGLLATSRDSSVWMIAGQEASSFSPSLIRIGPNGMHTFPNTGLYRQVMAADRKGNLWVANSTTIADFSDTLLRSIVSPTEQNPGTYIRTITFDTTNTLWAGLGSSYPDTAPAEIVKFTGSAWQRYKIPSGGCPFTAIDRIVCDRHGNFWVNSANVVRMFDGSTWMRSNRIDSVLAVSPLESIASDENGTVWFATGRALMRRASGGQVTIYDSTVLPVLSGGNIAGFTVNSSGRGVVALQGILDSYAYKIIVVDFSTRLIQDSISIRTGISLQQVIASPDGSVWCAFGNRSVGQWTRAAGFRQFDTTNSVLYSYVDGLVAGPDSSIWIGGKGLVRYKGSVWTRFDTSWNSLPGLYCTPLVVDKTGNLWSSVYQTETRFVPWGMGSEFVIRAQSIPAGLGYFDGEKWTNYTTINSGLPGNTVTCAAIGDSQTVWVGTNAGIGIFKQGALDKTVKPPVRRLTESSLTLSVVPARNSIKFRLPRKAAVTMMLFDCRGRRYKMLRSGLFSAGEHTLPLSGMGQNRRVLPGNVVVVRLEADYGDSRDQETAVFYRCK